MPTPHKEYPSLMVYDGGKGERATEGAFYIPARGMTLLKAVGQAWGAAYSKLTYVRLVNGNPWNKANLIYRASDTNCNAKIVPSTGASEVVYGKGPWIAVGCPYQAIWIPPRDFPYTVPLYDGKTPTGNVSSPGFTVGSPKGTVATPGFGSGTDSSRGSGGSSGGGFSSDPAQQASLAPKSKLGWIVIGGLGLAAIAYIYKRQTSKKRGK